MTDSRWDRTWTLFHAAMELAPAQRTAFLEAECGSDEALRREVEELLSNATSDGLLDHSPAVAAAAETLEGRRIGNYLVHGRLGSGGMGVVYEAEQESPVRRRVALKVIQAGSHPDVAARMAVERQALALMNHPNIARVFDAGVMEDGRPFIAMEHVEGVPINEYCDRHASSVAQRLELFAAVCHAIQHAHQKGIIHRDIKPSNVLVSEVDGVPTPKVIDFGVAKATTPITEGDAHHTMHGILIGTLEYMSPEQLDPAGGDTDTRSDIYSLGVMLYELLTGVLPFDWATLRRAGLDGVRKMTAEREPSRPSRRVRELDGERAASIASQRRTTPASLSRLLEGDLGWILLKALDRDRTRRYATASEFADDVRRHLAHEPVVAGPPSAAYRIRKFARRHRAGVATAAFLILLLSAVAVAMTMQSIEIRRAAELAERERIRAERVSQVMVDVFRASDPFEGRGADVTAREVLDGSTERIVRDLASEPEVQASVLDAIGRVYGELTVYDTGERLIRQALVMRRNLHEGDHPETAESLESLGQVLLDKGEHAAARRALEQAVAMSRRLFGPDDSRQAPSLFFLGAVRRQQGDLDAAEIHLREALRLCGPGAIEPRCERLTANALDELGNVAIRKGDFVEAESLFRQVLALRRRRSPDGPRTADTIGRLGALLVERGNNSAAEPLLREALALLESHLGPDHETLAPSLTNLGLCLHNQGKHREAESAYRRSLGIWRRLHGDAHHGVAINLNNLGLVAHDEGNFREGERSFREALAVMRRLLPQNHPNLAYPITNLARLFHEEGRPAEAEAWYREGLELRRNGLREGHPALADSLIWFGKLLCEQSETEQAERLLREGVGIRIATFEPDDWRIAEARSLLGGCLLAQGRYAEAEPLLVESWTALEDKRGKGYRRTLQALERVVALYEAWKRPEEAARYRGELQRNRAG